MTKTITKHPMVAFIFEQPLHKSLRQLRIATIALLLVSMDIMYRLVTILERGTELSPPQTIGAVATLAAAVFAAIWKGINNLTESYKEDE